jgi:hypothetical protein
MILDEMNSFGHLQAWHLRDDSPKSLATTITHAQLVVTHVWGLHSPRQMHLSLLEPTLSARQSWLSPGQEQRLDARVIHIQRACGL